MIEPVIFNDADDVDAQVADLANKGTVVTIVFAADGAMDVEEAIYASLRYVRDFSVGMTATGAKLGILCDVEGTRTAVTVDFRERSEVLN